VKTTPKQHAELRLWAIKAKVSVFVGADVLTALLDDLDEAIAVGFAARLLAAESARVGELAAERDALAAKLAEVRALHCEADNDYRRTPSCETCHGKAGVHECGCWSSEDRQMVCGHCNGDGRFESVPYPCPTVAILDRDGGE